MLRYETLPASWAVLLDAFRPCFTAPTFRTFVTLTCGMIARPARHTVTGMWIAAGVSRWRHHSRAHRFFSQAAWSVDQVCMVLLAVIVRELLPPGVPLLIAGDDTLFTRSGRRVHAAGWHHDAATKTKGRRDPQLRWGNCWVIAGIVVTLPLLDRPVCLPVAFALWANDTPGSHDAVQSKQALLGRLVTMITAACPDRNIHVVADCWYAGADGAPGAAIGATRHRGFPTGVTLTSRLKANTALHRIAVAVPGQPGRPKRIGVKIGTPADLATHPDTAWQPATVTRYGRTDTVTLTETLCLWYGVYRSRTVRIILLRDRGTTTGYSLALITTDLTTPANQIISRYAARWSIEVAFADAKQTTGVGQARNRTPNAVTRTVPFGLICQSLVIIWHTQHADTTADIDLRRAEAPWYHNKTRPAYHDMIVGLRRTLITAKYRGPSPHQPTHQQIHAITLAWEQAAA